MVCGRELIVCCYVDDVDPETYRCLGCRPVKQHAAPSSDLGEAMARARKAANV
jgi:hypothetical protein